MSTQEAQLFQDLKRGKVYKIEEDGGRTFYVGYYDGISSSNGKPKFSSVNMYSFYEGGRVGPEKIGILEYNFDEYDNYRSIYHIFDDNDNLVATLYTGAFKQVSRFGGKRKTKRTKRRIRKCKRQKNRTCKK